MTLSKSASETFGPIYYRNSSINSDKEYRIQLNWDGLNYIVTFMWGRRGSSLQRKRKTYRSERLARLVIEEKLQEKRAKGYADQDSRERAVRREWESNPPREAVKPKPKPRRLEGRVKRPAPPPPPPRTQVVLKTMRRVKLRD